MRDRMRMAMRAGAVVAFAGTASVMADDGCAPPYFDDGMASLVFDGTAKAYVVEDLDQDGALDLVVAGPAHAGPPGRIWTRFGNGDGTFTRAAASRIDGSPEAIVLHDVNGDGHLDGIVAESLLGTVVLAHGMPDGSFVTSDAWPVADAPTQLIAGDLNGDGAIDLVTRHDSAGVLNVLLNDGSGGFGTATEIGTSSTPVDVMLGDLNGDDIADLAVVNAWPSVLEVRLGLGDGTFAPATTTTIDDLSCTILRREVSGDAVPDLLVLVCGPADPVVQILVGDGTGAFSPAAPIELPSRPYGMTSHDTDGDGAEEIIVSMVNGTIEAYAQVGSASFALDHVSPAERLLLTPQVVDLDAEGAADLIALGSFGDIVIALGGATTGTFAAELVDLGIPFDFIRAADLNEDQTPDLIAVDGSTATILLRDRDGGFTVAGELTLGGLAASMTVADLDGDEHLDLAFTGRFFSDGIEVRLGAGDGTFRSVVHTPTTDLQSRHWTIDANDDGVLDLAVFSEYDDLLRVHLGFGDGSFSVPFAWSVPDGEDVTAVASADITGDGVRDVLFIRTDQDVVFICVGDASGGWAPPEVLVAIADPECLAVLDVDRDGRDDVMIGSRTEKHVLVYRATAGGGSELTARQTLIPVRGVVVADVSRDGTDDLLLLSPGVISITEGTDTGFTGDAIFQSRGAAPYRIDGQVLDFDGDGTLDLLEFEPDRLTVRRGRCAGTPSCPGDFDGDGVVSFDDLIVLLGAWGTADADLDGDGVTGFTDVVILLGGWGTC